MASGAPFSQLRFNTLDFTSSSNATPSDWHRNNHEVLSASHQVNCISSHNRVETDHEDRLTRARITEEQERTRRHLVQRVHNINNWQRKLENEIELARAELAKQTKNRERVYRALDATEVPMQIVQDNLGTRNRRIESDKIVDNVEVQMIEEKDHYFKKQKLLQDLHKQCQEMEAALNACIDRLQADWSDKLIANNADTHAGNLHNRHNQITGDDDGTTTEYLRSVQKWEMDCQTNISESASTRQKSAKLRDFSAQLIQAQALLSRKHNDIVNRALHSRLYETIQQKRNLDTKLAEVEAEFNRQETNAVRINTALKDIIPPFQVNLTRRRHRNQERPGQRENLHDPPEFQLLSERKNLDASQQMMVNRLGETQRILSELQERKDALRKEIRVKQLSIDIDQNECVPRRASFPSESCIMGWS